MSQETTQDLTQLHKFEECSQPRPEDDIECVATLAYEGPSGAEGSDIAIFPGEEIRIGRENDLGSPSFLRGFNNYTIQDPRVSKKHFRVYSVIYEEKKSYDTQSTPLPPLIYCEDLESSNGTYVNGRLIGIFGKEKVAYLLCDGDVIEIRPSWKFTFHQTNHQMIFPTTAQSKDMEYFFDRYHVSDRILGTGHYGQVYLGTELSTNKQVACKIIDMDTAIHNLPGPERSHATPGLAWKHAIESRKGQKQKILLEIEILSQLSHPNITHLRKAFCSSSSLYIFTDLAPAGDLFSYSQSHPGGHLDDYSARVVTLQIAHAIQYLHEQGIAHRDIKQENVLVTTTDFGGRVLLTDFGFATYTNKVNGRMLSRVGTDGCVAPEVGNFDNAPLGYTKAVDLYSLGVLTASLLTGNLTIPREELKKFSQVEVGDRFVGIDDDYMRRKWKSIPPRAVRFIRKLVDPDPKERLTAIEAVSHSWYTKPASEAAALAEGIKRINRFWEKRMMSSAEGLEGLPGVVLSYPTISSKDTPGPKFRRKIPDATSSPYFGLDRLLNQKAPPGRKRLLDEINESGSPFITSSTQQRKTAAVSIASGAGYSGMISVEGTDLFSMSPEKRKVDVGDIGGGIKIVDLESGEEKANTPASSQNAEKHSSLNSSTKRAKKVYDEQSRAPVPTPSRSSPLSTSADALRGTVSKMKI